MIKRYMVLKMKSRPQLDEMISEHHFKATARVQRDTVHRNPGDMLIIWDRFANAWVF